MNRWINRLAELKAGIPAKPAKPAKPPRLHINAWGSTIHPDITYNSNTFPDDIMTKYPFICVTLSQYVDDRPGR
jgi:hypothetical protein